MKLSPTDTADLERIRVNLATYAERRQGGQEATFYAEWAGVLSVNVAELLHLVDRLAASPARRDWDAEAAEAGQYAGVMAADLADQQRMDRSAS